MSETAIKKSCCDALELAGYVVTRTAASGYRGRAMGCKKGTSDIHVTSKLGRAVWLEIKCSHREHASDGQIEFGERVKRLGAFFGVVWDPSMALDALRQADQLSGVPGVLWSSVQYVPRHDAPGLVASHAMPLMKAKRATP